MTRRLRALWVALMVPLTPVGSASAADGGFPFEGTWTQIDHVCTAGATRVRTYTAKEVTSPRGRCTIRRIASGAGLYELLEECRHEKSSKVTEIIRMTSPDSLVLRRQVVRLKIPRQLRFVRCTAAAPGTAAPSRVVGRPAPPELPKRNP